MKVLVWILVGLGGLVAVAVIGLIFLGRSAASRAQEGQRFAANATQADCADEVAKRARECPDFGIRCITEISLFAPPCIAAAQPSQGQEFCASVPPPTDGKAIAEWSETFCAPRGLEVSRCGVLAGLLSSACARAQRASDPSS